MKVQVSFVLFAAIVICVGCSSPSTTSSHSTEFPDLTGNWQIVSTLSSTNIPPPAVVLFGALQSSASHVQGTFRFTNLAQPSTCGLNQVVGLSGTVDSNNNLTLTSSTLSNGTTIKAQFTISSSQPYVGTGTIEVDGNTCAFATAPATAEEISNATGTYTGLFSPGMNRAPEPGTPGTVTLALTQSTNAETDGRFSATGSLNYQFGSCSGSVDLVGSISAIGVIMSSPIGPNAPSVHVEMIGTINTTASKIVAPYLSFSPAPCSTDPTSNAHYYGELDRQ